MVSYSDPLVRQEQYKDLLREAERERLIRTDGLRQPGHWKMQRKVARWIAAQMVRWDCRLQRHSRTPPLCCPQVAR